ncbi:MAG: hypothetical protein ACLSC9_02465 [Barnesiella sp.]
MMKEKITVWVLLAVLFSGVVSCRSSKAPAVLSNNYNKKKDRTECVAFPLGTVYLPGIWDKKDYDFRTRQQFFLNADSTVIALNFATQDGYEFNTDKRYKGYEFVKEFYRWKSDDFGKKGFTVTLLDNDSIENRIIWSAEGVSDNSGRKIEALYLVTEHKGRVAYIALYDSPRLTREERIGLIRRIEVK